MGVEPAKIEQSDLSFVPERDIPASAEGVAGLSLYPALSGLFRLVRGRILRSNVLGGSRLVGLPEDKVEMLSRLWPNGLDADIQQGHVGDCYLAASLYGFCKNPVAPYILAKIMTENVNDRGGVCGWNVGFSYGPGERKVVTVNSSTDLEGQVVEYGNGRTSKKTPISGQLGDKVIERAFAECRRVRICLSNEDQGSAETASLKHVANAVYAMAAVEGGNSVEPLMGLFGPEYARWAVVGCSGKRSISFQTNGIEEAESLFIKYFLDPDSFILTASTISDGEGYDYYKVVLDDVTGEEKKKYYMDSSYRFVEHHVFAIVDVDIDARTVTLVDPHDTRKCRYTISYGKFFSYFSKISGVELFKKRLTRDFSGLEFNEQKSVSGVYGTSLKCRKPYLFPALNDRQLLKVCLGGGHRVIISKRWEDHSGHCLCTYLNVTSPLNPYKDLSLGDAVDDKTLFRATLFSEDSKGPRSGVVFGKRLFLSRDFSQGAANLLCGLGRGVVPDCDCLRDYHVKISLDQSTGGIEITALYPDYPVTVECIDIDKY